MCCEKKPNKGVWLEERKVGRERAKHYFHRLDVRFIPRQTSGSRKQVDDCINLVFCILTTLDMGSHPSQENTCPLDLKILELLGKYLKSSLLEEPES